MFDWILNSSLIFAEKYRFQNSHSLSSTVPLVKGWRLCKVFQLRNYYYVRNNRLYSRLVKNRCIDGL